MLFNTPEFIFLFLPFAVLLYYTLGRWSPAAAIIGTILSSLIFYAWWNPPFVLLPIASIAANFLLASRIAMAEKGTAKSLLVIGIVTNLAPLCYFKYWDFLVSIVDGHKAGIPNVPLALSFTTFVQIAFLVDVYRRRVKLDFSRYAFFVAFFPHLIAGPIVRWSSFGRQLFDPQRTRVDWNNIALGLTIFTFGLVKKVLIADELAPHVSTAFDAVARGDAITGAAAWGAALGFTAQIFFDFSGYSDMAIGLGLLFNLRLPVNFAAPLRATNMGDMWRRWHVTLSRWLLNFVYAPLGTGRGDFGRSLALAATMVLAGLWHGAGWTFIAWGAFQGVNLVIFQRWRAIRGNHRPSKPGLLFGWFLTFTTFVIGAVFFRAADIGTSWHMLVAMAGFSDAVTPDRLTLLWDSWSVRRGYISEHFVLSWFGNHWSVTGSLWTAVALAIALLLPDTMEITDYREGDAQSDWRRSYPLLAWRPSLMWFGVCAAMFIAVFTTINRVSEFLYYQF